MSPTDRTPFSIKHFKLERLSFENDEVNEDVLDENELIDNTDSLENVDDDEETYDSCDEDEEENNDDDSDNDFGCNTCDDCLTSTPTGRFSTLDHSLKLHNVRRRLFVENVRRRLFSYDDEDVEIEEIN